MPIAFKLTAEELKRFHALRKDDHESAAQLFRRMIAREEARQEYTDEKGFLTIIDPATGEKVKITQ